MIRWKLSLQLKNTQLLKILIWYETSEIKKGRAITAVGSLNLNWGIVPYS